VEGFNTERLTIRGRLAVKEADLRNLELSIQGDITAIRMLLPAFAPLTEIKAEQAAVQREIEGHCNNFMANQYSVPVFGAQSI
jgi:hypothetical protein